MSGPAPPPAPSAGEDDPLDHPEEVSAGDDRHEDGNRGVGVRGDASGDDHELGEEARERREPIAAALATTRSPAVRGMMSRSPFRLEISVVPACCSTKPEMVKSEPAVKAWVNIWRMAPSIPSGFPDATVANAPKRTKPMWLMLV